MTDSNRFSYLRWARSATVAAWFAGELVLLSAPASPAPGGETLAASPSPVVIAREGVAVVPIVIAPGASPAVRETASQLAGFLQRMTSANFVIEESREPRGITLGTLDQFPDSALKEPLAIKNLYDGLEAFVIRCDEGRIRLLGNTDLGASHAAYRFLELLGCRWFFSASAWEVIPSTRDLSFGWNESTRPDMWSRVIWFGLNNDRQWEKGDPGAAAAFAVWKTRNRMAESLEVRISHRWHAIPRDFKEEFAEHPEYFALVDGERKGPQFCVTNTGLQKVAIAYADAYFAKNPESDMLAFDPADGVGWCTCSECAALGHPSNQAYYLANAVGRHLRKAHAGKFLGLLAYSWHSDPPSFPVEENVYVMLTNGMNASKFTFDELFAKWAAKGNPFGIYEYFSYWHKDQSMLPGRGLSNNIDALGPRFQRYVANGVNAMSAESANNWGVNGLVYYIANKLMWKASADVGALKRDFYEKAFGPASAVMERYYERLNHANNPLAGAALIRQCQDDLDEAAAAAAGHPEVLVRLYALKENLIFTYLGMKAENASGLEERKSRIFDWLVWGFRTRNNYMNDWLGFRYGMSKVARKELNEPTWSSRDTRDNPWKRPDPVTREECDKIFAAIREDFGALPAVTEVRYSSQNVMVDTGGGEGDERALRFSPQASLLMASRTGEPLRFELDISEFEAFETRDAKYSVVDSSGKDVLRGELPAGRHLMEIKVPEPGIYRFTCRRGGAGWSITLPEGMGAALPYTRGEAIRPSAIRPAYFYVPKGVAEFTVYAFGNQVLKVRDPDGKMAFEGNPCGSYVKVPVSESGAGKVWSIEGRVNDLWLFNVPTILSFHPRWLFVPDDLAAKDDLAVVPF